MPALLRASIRNVPPLSIELRLGAPLEAQEASYLAASARIASFARNSMPPLCRAAVSRT